MQISKIENQYEQISNIDGKINLDTFITDADKVLLLNIKVNIFCVG